MDDRINILLSSLHVLSCWVDCLMPGLGEQSLPSAEGGVTNLEALEIVT